jgi:hypothetical protein
MHRELLNIQPDLDLLSEEFLLNWTKSSPARLLTVVKHLIDKQNVDLAIRLLDYLIKKEEFHYPSAHYYKAFILLEKKKTSNQDTKVSFIRELRAFEGIVDRHIEQQMAFDAIIATVNQCGNKSGNVFYTNDSYRVQKQNMIRMLELFVQSSQSLCGNYCSDETLRTACAIQDAGRAVEIFGNLIKKGYIKPCCTELSGSELDKAIRKVVERVGVSSEHIQSLLSAFEKCELPSKFDIESKSDTSITRIRNNFFWEPLKKSNVIQHVEKFIVLDNQNENPVKDELLKNKKKYIRFKDDLSWIGKERQVVLFKPTFASFADLDKQNKIIFKKKIIFRVDQ